MDQQKRKRILAVVDTLAEQIVRVRDPTQGWKDAILHNLKMIADAVPEPEKSETREMHMTLEEAHVQFTAAVQVWRRYRDADPSAGSGWAPEERERKQHLKDCAPFYIDAFQSVLIALFGELVPGMDEMENQEEL